MATGTPEAHVSLSLQTGAFEVAGSEAFVANYQPVIDALVARIQEEGPALPAQAQAVARGNGMLAADLGEFPEALHSLKSSSGTDQILVAGKFSAATSSDGTFGTSDASSLLIEQGIKLSNPAQSMTNNLKAKRVFKVGKNWKISKAGEEHLKSLLG